MEEKDIDLIIWDLETTGFVAPQSKILEIGALVIRNGEVEKKHWVFQNNCEIPAEITELTGITKELIDKEGRDPKECLAEFLPLFKRCKKHVTHNGFKFDIPFLLAYAADLMQYTEEQKTAVRILLEQTLFDTAVHFKSQKLGLKQNSGESYNSFSKRVMDVRAFGVKYNLALCAQESEIDLTGIVAHRAMADVEVTYKIFQVLTKQESLFNTDEPF